jgi:flagellar biosynthesis GTPase FlhF
MEFPKTLKAVKKADGNLWTIGDALIDECGRPSKNGSNDGSLEKIKAASQYLEAQGFTYKVKTLSNIRVVADIFGSSFRRPGIAWGAHRVAVTPEYLEAIIAGAPKGVKVSQPYIEGIRAAQMADAQAEREAAEEEARKERQKAEKAEAEAKAAAQKAEAAEKAEAEAKLEKAKKKTARAKAKEKEVEQAPKKKQGPPSKEEQSDLALRAKFLSNASRSIKLAQTSAKNIQDYIDRLSPTSVRALTDCALEAANAWTDAANVVRGVTKDHSGHLSVVGE